MVSLLLLLALPIFLLFVVQKYKKNGARNLPPGPRGLPIIGNVHQLDIKFLPRSLWEFSNKFGPLMSLRLGFKPTIVISSARILREVTKTHDLCFSGRPNFIAQQKLTYEGSDLVISQYGNNWREMRKLCMIHLFSSKRVESFHPIRVDEVSRLIAKISENAASSKINNLGHLSLSLGMSFVCRVALGKRYEKEQKRLHRLLDEVQAVLGGFFYQDYYPYMGWLDKINGMYRQLQQCFKELDSFYQEIIDEHLDPERSKSNVEDFMDVLLNLKRDNLFSGELTWNHIKGLLMNVLIAGIDTGAATIEWTMTLLMQNQGALKKVQEEIRSIIGDKGVVEEDDIQKFPYFKCVVKEVMRLQPVAPFVQRETLEHCTIDGYDIKPQTLVFINSWAIARDPEVWEKPNDFYPERFLGKSIDFRGQDQELVPFGVGRRICPGITMAMANINLALTNLLYSFDWALPPGMKPEDIDMTPLPGLVFSKKVPLCLMAKNYNYNVAT